MYKCNYKDFLNKGEKFTNIEIISQIQEIIVRWDKLMEVLCNF